jgi:hypothetical protein
MVMHKALSVVDWILFEAKLEGFPVGASLLGSQMNVLAHCRLGFESNISCNVNDKLSGGSGNDKGNGREDDDSEDGNGKMKKRRKTAIHNLCSYGQAE